MNPGGKGVSLGSGSGMLDYVNSLKKGGKPADEIAKMLAANGITAKGLLGSL